MKESNLSIISDLYIVNTNPFICCTTNLEKGQIWDISVVYLVWIYLNATLYIYLQCDARLWSKYHNYFIIISSTFVIPATSQTTHIFQKQASCSKALINKFTQNAQRNMKKEC